MSQLTQSEARLCADVNVHMPKLSGGGGGGDRDASAARGRAGKKTRLMFSDRQKPATLFNVALIRGLPVLASHSSIL